MLGIAVAYRRLNMWHVNCGSTYVWGARAISPYFGWMTGWVIILAYFLGATSIAYPIGPYALSIFSNPWQDSSVAAAAIGAIAIVIVTGIAYVGIRATSRVQGLLILIEYTAITIVGILGLIGIFGGGSHSEHFHWSWFSWDTLGGFIFSTLGRLPEEGEVLRSDNVALTVKRVKERRVDRVGIEILEPVG